MLGRSTALLSNFFAFLGGKQCPPNQLVQLSEILWCVTLALRLDVACDGKKQKKMQGKKLKKSPESRELSEFFGA